MGINNEVGESESEKRERLIQSYEELANGFVSEGGIPYGLRGDYRALRDAFERYNRAPHEVHVGPNKEAYLGAANRTFSEKLEKFRSKRSRLTGEGR